MPVASKTARPAGLSAAGPSKKKARRAALPPPPALNIPTGSDLNGQRERYSTAEPYKYAAISGLINNELLESVVEESRTYGTRGEEGSLAGWGWEQKETDIYKIQQTPDLSSLDPEHLPDETLAALPQLTRLKDALYSQEFRNYIREVTGCGPLSGKKTDGSVGLYTQGSHLLLHDDSISTRLVSYILYLPNSPLTAPSPELTPSSSNSFLKGWNPSWGGSLELYPVQDNAEVGPPMPKRSAKEDVKWGQIVFFEVRPGRSYHAVEEVIVGDGRQRLGVSGWFHRPIEGEEGFEEMDEGKAKEDLSSLAQITSAPSLPFTPYEAPPPPGLTPSHLTFLKNYLSPSYLTAATLEKLSGQFVAASEIVLHNLLHPDLAKKLKSETQTLDQAEYSSSTSLSAQDLGEKDGWSIQGPPSKHRYLSLTSPLTSTPTYHDILTNLLPSEPFRAWLSVVSSLAPTGHRIEARRFRKGLDYTLAAGEESSGEARLDVWLGATWWADGVEEDEELVEHGGWECYIAAPEEGDDPAVFKSDHARKGGEEDINEEGVENATNGTAGREAISQPAAAEGASSAVQSEKSEGAPNGDVGGMKDATAEEGDEEEASGGGSEIDPSQLSPSDFDTDSEGSSEDDDDQDGPLLTQSVSFNTLLIVCRDPGVMRFVKYLGAGAKGSRWDLGGEWEVGVLEADEDKIELQ